LIPKVDFVGLYAKKLAKPHAPENHKDPITAFSLSFSDINYSNTSTYSHTVPAVVNVRAARNPIVISSAGCMNADLFQGGITLNTV
jgi:hypothetical protein